MYPLKFDNIYFEKVWGGIKFSEFRNNVPTGMIGESWDISCHGNSISIVSNGDLAGHSLKEIIEIFKEKLIGTKINSSIFPLLIKLINSKEKLSIQVHPTDEYAMLNEHEMGKTEAWYVIDAEPNAKLVLGTKNCNKKIFKNAIESDNIYKYLNIVNIKKGDFFLINSGVVHAIWEGVVIAEIQQNSDITYRVYDYGRERELHINKALDVINFNNSITNHDEIIFNYNDYKIQKLCATKHFNIDKIIINKKFEDVSNIEGFFLLTVVDGEGTIESEGYKMNIYKGDSIFIPATLGKYRINGESTILKTYI